MFYFCLVFKPLEVTKAYFYVCNSIIKSIFLKQKYLFSQIMSHASQG